ncbi:MAG: DUF58 domain-containing protein [Campylobacterales bacterium]
MQEDRNTIKRAKALNIKTKKRVFSENAGLNLSSYFGEGFDFAEVREYQSGDDIRSINWSTTAKLQKIFVNIYKQERELNIVCIFMQEGSMEFGTTISKKEFIAEIATIIGYSALKNRDCFEYGLFCNSDLKLHKINSLMGVENMLLKVTTTPLFGFKNDPNRLDKLLHKIRKRSLIFLLGDFFTPPKLKATSQKHEIVPLIVRDRFEEEPKSLGNEVFRDLNTTITTEGELNQKAIKEYKRLSLELDSRLFSELNRYGFRYRKIYTDQNPYIELSKLFMDR